MFRPALLLAGCIALVAATSSVNAEEEHDRSSLTRQTAFGPVVGVDESGAYAWKGVPFAKPPTGELRWRAPVDPDKWRQPKLTQTFGNACVQYGRIYGPGANNRYDMTIATTLNQAVGQEDCLYLNIWRPATHQGGLPVIVFVHGGSNVSGYTADPVYNGAALAKAANAVVVTVNYRLGIFGFLNVPQLKTGDPIGDSGNFALLDIVKALEFIRHNVSNFGGNPANITLTGQSAGAINVYAMLTSPLTVNATPQLFHRAAAFSGGISLASELPPGSIPTLSPAAVYLLQGNALLTQQLIVDGLASDAASAAAYIAAHSAAEIAAYLRSRTPSALLLTLLTKLAALGLAGSGPIPDGAVLPVNPVAAIRAGDYVHVPFLASNTRDEAKLFPTFLPLVGGSSPVRLVTDAQLFTIQFNYDPNAAPQVMIGQWIAGPYLPVTTPVTGFNAMTDLLNNHFFIPSRDNVLNALRDQQHDVWYYRFDWDREPAPFDDIYGAAHAFDLAFLFGNFGPSLFSNIANSEANKPGRLELSGAMMRSLAAFAQRGDPNDRSLGVYWPAWPKTLVFDASDTEAEISVH
jgi:para-nitrobenzyl esterase